MDVIAKIDALRKERGWSVYKLSEEAMLTQSTVANIFSRGTMPTIATLQQICDAFEISLAQFFSEPNELETQDEVSLLTQYKLLDKGDKQIIKKMAEFMVARQKNQI